MPGPTTIPRPAVFALAPASAVGMAGHADADVRVHGATTVAFGLMNSEKSRIEQLAKAEVTVLPSSTSHGLADLVEGKADIAMLAEPLANIAASMNSKQPGYVFRTP